MRIKKICILGGTGFIGGHLVARLAQENYQIRVPTRHRERHRQLLVLPNVKLVEANILDPHVLREQLKGCDTVINLIGILQGNAQNFDRVHAQLPAEIVAACEDLGIERYLHMSAINADAEQGPSLYLKSKGRGETAAHAGAEHGLRVTSFQPSVVFGIDDNFLNMFAKLLRISPFFPVACPESRFAPVWVGDVVEAFMTSLLSTDAFGQRYALCGPQIFTFQELVVEVARLIGKKRFVVPLSNQMSELQAKVMDKIPGSPMSWDNYLSLQVDSVCSENGLQALGIPAHAIDTVMADHFGGHADPLSEFRRQGRD